MATAESAYDGFISYSHAADELLAPRLQAALQRFAKPWWRRRALRVFRDESSLSANPHLWGSITQALDDSDWFVLLLSDEAAASEWVDREVEYWLAHKNPSRIIPVVTDGRFGWLDGSLSPDTTAAPPSLRRAFVEEPRWVDLRWARTEDHLDLSNARFRDAVADIASAMRQVPKDELESEEVRQHRRTVRTAGAAGVVVLLLAIAATVGGLLAVAQSSEARLQRSEAEHQAEVARTNEDLAREQADLAVQRQQFAEEQQRIAEEERARAESEARISLARALAAGAVEALDRDQDRALLLALSSVAVTREASEPVLPEAVDSLYLALSRHRISARIGYGAGTGLAWSPDGSLIVITPEVDSSTEAAIWSLADGRRVATLAGPSETRGATWSRSGEIVVTSHKFGEVVLWTADGHEIATLDNGRSAAHPVISDGGELLAVDEAGPLVRVWDLDSLAERFAIDVSPTVDINTGATASGQGASGPMAFSPDAGLLAIAELEPDGVSVWDMATGKKVWSVPVDAGDVISADFDPTGSLVGTLHDEAGAGRISIWDLDSRTEVLTFATADEPTTMEWSSTGGLIAVGGASRVVEVFDVADGRMVERLFGHGAAVTAVAFGCVPESHPLVANPASMHACTQGAFGSLASTDADGTTLAWDLEDPFAKTLAVDDGYVVFAAFTAGDTRAVVASSAGEVVLVETAPPFSVVARVEGLRGTGPELNRYGEYEVVESPPVVVASGRSVVAAPTPNGRILALDPSTLDEIETANRARVHALSPTGSVALVENWSPQRLGGECIAYCPPVLLDWLTGEGQRTIATVVDPDGESIEGVRTAAFSPDGSLVAVASVNQNFRIHEVPPPVPAGETSTASPAPVLARLDTSGVATAEAVAFSRDGSLLAAGESSGQVRVVDVTSVADDDDGDWVLAEFTAMDGPITAMRFTPDGKLLAVSGIGTVVNFWSASDWSRVFSIDIGGQTSSLDFSGDGSTLLTSSGQSRLVWFYPLDLDHLLALASERVTRGFTDDECSRFLGTAACASAPDWVRDLQP